MGLGQKALEASLRNATGLRSFALQKSLETVRRNEMDIEAMKKSEMLYYNPKIYRVERYSSEKAVKLTRLVFKDARDLSARYAGRAEWRGVDPSLKEWSQTFVRRLISKRLPFHVQEAMRSDERQTELFLKGHSKIKNGGMHQKGKAVDIVHSKFFWQLTVGEWASIGMLGHTLAADLGIKIRWGGDWDADGDIHDHSLFDPAHWELLPDDA